MYVPRFNIGLLFYICIVYINLISYRNIQNKNYLFTTIESTLITHIVIEHSHRIHLIRASMRRLEDCAFRSHMPHYNTQQQQQNNKH